MEPTSDPNYSQENYQRASEQSFGSVMSRIGQTVTKQAGRLGSKAGRKFKGSVEKGLKKMFAGVVLSPIIAPIMTGILIAGLIIGLVLFYLLMFIINLLIFVAIFILFTLFVVFIINSGAYMVPQLRTTITSLPGGVDADCPAGWSVNPQSGSTYFISQGPMTTWSHTNREAIDISRSGTTVNPNDVVVATHNGVVTHAQPDYAGGLWVEIEGSCSGQTFRSWHVHFSSLSVNVGDTVHIGSVLGIMGMTGEANAFHDHYEFPDHYPTMINVYGQSYIPITVPQGCVGVAACGNIYIP